MLGVLIYGQDLLKGWAKQPKQLQTKNLFSANNNTMKNNPKTP